MVVENSHNTCHELWFLGDPRPTAAQLVWRMLLQHCHIPNSTCPWRSCATFPGNAASVTVSLNGMNKVLWIFCLCSGALRTKIFSLSSESSSQLVPNTQLSSLPPTKIFILNVFVYCICIWTYCRRLVFCLHVCLNITCMTCTYRGQKRASDPQGIRWLWDLGLWGSNDCETLCGCGNETRSSTRATSVVNHCIIFPNF